MGPHAISARMVLRIAAFCAARGHNVEALCEGAGLSALVLSERDARVDYAAVEGLCARALALTGDDNFGLHLAQDVRDTQHFDTGVLLMMASPTVRVALERMARHQRYWGDGERVALVPTDKGIVVRFALRGAGGAFARHGDECAMAELALGLQTLAGPERCARVVRFRHAAPSALDEHHALFRCSLQFGRPHTELELDDSVLDTPMPHANAAFFAIFESQLERAVGRLPRASAASETVRASVRAALASGDCTLATTARVLGVSARTLQRRLRADGTTFADLVDALRYEMACAYLERAVPIPELASLLGYADATAFHHAFKRWTGSSPLRHRLGAPKDCSDAPKS